MSHNLPEAGRPGWTYQAGTHLSTAQTWWELSGQLHACLARDGATILGERPERTYGLRGYPVEEPELRALAMRLWGRPAAGPVERQHERGRIIAGKPARDVLREQGLGPDFEVSPASLRGQMDFIHRRTVREDIYFVRNAGTNAVRFEATFRVRGRQPELWDAVHGTMTPLAAFAEGAGGTHLPMELDGHGSVFVVFTQPQRKRPHVTAISRAGQSLFPNRDTDAPGFTARYAPDGTVHFDATAPGDYTLGLSNGRPTPTSPARSAAGAGVTPRRDPRACSARCGSIASAKPS